MFNTYSTFHFSSSCFSKDISSKKGNYLKDLIFSPQRIPYTFSSFYFFLAEQRIQLEKGIRKEKLQILFF